MQSSTSGTAPVITCDGTGVVSHAGTVLLAELADRIGLTAALGEATDGLRERRAKHDPGKVLVDVAVAIADGAVSISDVPAFDGAAGSARAGWQRRVEPDDLAGAGRRRQHSWDAGGDPAGQRAGQGPGLAGRGELTGSELPGSRAAGKTIGQVVIDLDATLVTAHSDKEGAKGNFKGGFGYHPLGAWLDNTGEALAAVLRPGNAGSNTAADHLTDLDWALSQLPDRWRSTPILIRADGAGYSHALISSLSQQGLEFSVGYPVNDAVRDATATVRKWARQVACNADGDLREHADVVEVTKMLDLSRWTDCPGMRVIVGRELPHPEAFWTEFLRDLRDRGLTEVQLVISDAHRGLVNASGTALQTSSWQRCRVAIQAQRAG